MISLEEILKLHQLSANLYGGATGIRDNDLLESAISRPFQQFGGEELYPTTIAKAAAIAESIIINHPFIDGNKRTGFLAMFALLRQGGIRLTADDDATYEMVIRIATGELNFEAIVVWIEANIK